MAKLKRETSKTTLRQLLNEIEMPQGQQKTNGNKEKRSKVKILPFWRHILPTQSSTFNHPDYRRTLKALKFLIVKLSPIPILIFLGPEYSTLFYSEIPSACGPFSKSYTSFYFKMSCGTRLTDIQRVLLKIMKKSYPEMYVFTKCMVENHYCLRYLTSKLVI